MNWVSFTVDCIPVVNQFKSGIEFVTGYDPITWKKLDPISRGISGIGILPFGKIPKYGKKIGKGVGIAQKVWSIDSNTAKDVY